jgi:Trk K+ transport system NAD-binding subunit
VVIGLGRFGGAVTESLARVGRDVLGIDQDAGLVQSWSDRLTHVVQADSTTRAAAARVVAKRRLLPEDAARTVALATSGRLAQIAR